MKIESKLLLKPKDLKPSFKKWSVEGVLNPAAVRVDGKIILYTRVAEVAGSKHKQLKTCPVVMSEEDYKKHYKKLHKEKVFKMAGSVVQIKNGMCRLSTISHFRKVELSSDGMTVKKIHQHPAFVGKEGDGKYGVEDPRIVKIGNTYYMTYVAVMGHEGVCTNLAISKDLRKWERKGIIFREQNKDAFLFPEKIRGRYVALHRPEGFFEFSKPSIWISHSPDMKYWGDEKSIMRPRKDSWEEHRMGGGAPPIKTKKGWLLIYHGVKNVRDKSTYSAGAALLDLKDPSKVIARSPKNKPLIKPGEKYEKSGFIDNVVFPTGAVLSNDKKDLLIYAGGADSIVSVKKIAIKDIFRHMKKVKKG
ncbi:MAG: glycoside hydrolase family 130 protein [Candidatus Nanoarchaeia archaeon]